MREEIEILRDLQHPSIIEIHEVFETPEHIHLVLARLEGGELFERVRTKHTYSEKTAIALMRNMLSALAYMHEKRVVHRDLKPENLILRSKEDDADVVIADFGLGAYMPPNGQLLKMRCGSPGYAAPELLLDKGYDTGADVFSMGAILYVMLCGRSCFRGAGQNDILQRNRRADVDYPDRLWGKISPQAKDFCARLLEKDAKKRMTAASALQHEWLNLPPEVED